MVETAGTPAELDVMVEAARQRYIDARPLSAQAHEEARVHLPGGNTRSVLHFDPFPYRVATADGAVQTDLDGHTYVDFCGNYTAGLFGHSNEVIRDAIVATLDDGWAIGGVRAQEATLAKLLCERFPSLDQVRFTNSGTEANLMAIGTALHHADGDGVMVFDRGYHGGVLSFRDPDAPPSPLNAPYDFTVCDFNDTDGAVAQIETGRFGCVVVEPVQGSAGCRVGDLSFLRGLRDACDRTGTLLIFDEVMTSRLSASGAQGRFGVTPDLTTLGKYFGGGMSFGAFGGRADVMAHFDADQGGVLTQAGTFNNNAASINAAVAVLTEVLTPPRLDDVNARGDELRGSLNEVLQHHDRSLEVIGLGSMLCVHATDPRELELLFLHLLDHGLFIAPRGFIALSMAITDDHTAQLVAAVEDWAEGSASR